MQGFSLMVWGNDVQGIEKALSLTWFKYNILYFCLRFGIFTWGWTVVLHVYFIFLCIILCVLMISILLLIWSLFFLDVIAHDKVVQDWYSLVLTQLNKIKCWDLNLIFLVFIGEIHYFSASLHLYDGKLRFRTWLDELLFLYLSPIFGLLYLFLRTIYG